MEREMVRPLAFVFLCVILPVLVEGYQDEDEAVEAIISFMGGVFFGICEKYETCIMVTDFLATVIGLVVIFGLIVGAIPWKRLFNWRCAHNIACGTAGYAVGSMPM